MVGLLILLYKWFFPPKKYDFSRFSRKPRNIVYVDLDVGDEIEYDEKTDPSTYIWKCRGTKPSRIKKVNS